jgi:hypothetical protein
MNDGQADGDYRFARFGLNTGYFRRSRLTRICPQSKDMIMARIRLDGSLRIQDERIEKTDGRFRG